MALIKRLPTEPKFNFIGRHRLTLALSAVLVVVSLGLFVAGGLNYGVDFRGGIDARGADRRASRPRRPAQPDWAGSASAR